MTRADLTYVEPLGVKITQARWNVWIEIEKSDGTVEKFIASADHGATWGDGIFFGTPEEYKEQINP
jgi:hypothetical protein